VKYVGYMFQKMLCSQIKIRSREHTMMHVFVRFTITKRIVPIDADTQISDPFAMFGQLT